MGKSERIVFMASPGEKRMLLALAEREHCSRSEVIRSLVRREARRCGLWPPDADGQRGEPASRKAGRWLVEGKA